MKTDGERRDDEPYPMKRVRAMLGRFLRFRPDLAELMTAWVRPNVGERGLGVDVFRRVLVRLMESAVGLPVLLWVASVGSMCPRRGVWARRRRPMSRPQRLLEW